MFKDIILSVGGGSGVFGGEGLLCFCYFIILFDNCSDR